MFCIQIHDLWVVACIFGGRHNLSLAGDEVFTLEQEAIQERDRAHAQFLAMPLRTSDESGYVVMRLSEYLEEMKVAAEETGRRGSDRR